MVVPKQHDPGYAAGDKAVSPLTSIFRTPGAFQHIRPLPVAAGGIVAFTHRLLHWGSAADPHASGPRIAIAFAASDPEFAPPYFSTGQLPLPSLPMRLALTAGQTLAYFQNEQYIRDKTSAETLGKVFMRQSQNFHGSYRHIVTSHIAVLDGMFADADHESAAGSDFGVLDGFD